MRELTGLEIMLLDDYYRCERHIEVISQELENDKPIGYISRKTINGKVQHYLQWKEGGKIKSKYINDDELPLIEKKIERRKAFQENIKELKHDMKIIKRALGGNLIEKYRDKI